mgnify:CR=1 FL=1
MQTQTQTTAFKQWFSDHEDALLATARDIFAHPELSGEETYSSHRLAQLLEEAGFRITWGIGGFDTAFLAEWGQGKPILGFLAEYDALPGLGQAAAMAIDAMRAPDVVGTLGGDDTVFAVMRDNDSAQKFCTQARDILK